MIVDGWDWLVEAVRDVWEFLAYSRRERLRRQTERVMARRRPRPVMDPATAQLRWRERLAAQQCRYCRSELPAAGYGCSTCGASARMARQP